MTTVRRNESVPTSAPPTCQEISSTKFCADTSSSSIMPPAYATRCGPCSIKRVRRLRLGGPGAPALTIDVVKYQVPKGEGWLMFLHDWEWRRRASERHREVNLPAFRRCRSSISTCPTRARHWNRIARRRRFLQGRVNLG